jgi:MFS family permease
VAGRWAVLTNGALLRSLLSFFFAFTAEWAFTVAIGIFAYAEGGAVAVGLVAVVRLLPAALLAPAITTFADRMPRERMLFASSAVRGIATLAAAPVLLSDGPAWIVYLLAVVSTIAFTPFRASHSALMPSLCRSPEELTSVNVARGFLDSVSVIVGPLVAALLVAMADVAAVFIFAGGCALISAVLLIRLDYERIPIATGERPRLVADVREGLAAVAGNDGLGMVVGLVALQAAFRGAFTVFVLVVAIDLLDGTESSAGVLQGAVGIGALVGSLLCTMLVGSRAMTRWLGIAVVLWGAPLAAFGIVPVYAVALLASAVIGIGNALVDVTAFTLIARMAPNNVLARVFGVLESLGAFAVAAGSLAAPLLIEVAGAETALLVVGAIAPVVCALAWRRLTSIDQSLSVRTDDIHLLREVPMLRPLPVPVIEQLAQRLDHLSIAPGATLFRAGDVGDSFYVIAGGRVDVLDDERLIRTMGEGDGFGEIALLGNTTRTMTIRAVDDVALCSISSADFIPAVTSMGEARSAAEATRWSHLNHAPGTAADT